MNFNKPLSREEEEGKAFYMYMEQEDIGNLVKSSKKRIKWRFCFGPNGPPHEVVLVHSVVSQKKKITLDGVLLYNAQKVVLQFAHTFTLGGHLLRVEINGETSYEYDFLIDNRKFERLERYEFNASQLPKAQTRTSDSSGRRSAENSVQRGSGQAFDMNSFDPAPAKKETPSKKVEGSSGQKKKTSTQKKSPASTLKPVASPGFSASFPAQNSAPVIDFMSGDIAPSKPTPATFDPFGDSSSSFQQPAQPTTFDPFATNVGRSPASTEVLNLGVEFSQLTFSGGGFQPFDQNNQFYKGHQDDEDTDEEEIDAWKKAQEMMKERNILMEKPRPGESAQPKVNLSLNDLAKTRTAEEKKSVMRAPAQMAPPVGMGMGMGMGMQGQPGMAMNPHMGAGGMGMGPQMGMGMGMGMQGQPGMGMGMGMQGQPGMGMNMMGGGAGMPPYQNQMQQQGFGQMPNQGFPQQGMQFGQQQPNMFGSPPGASNNQGSWF